MKLYGYPIVKEEGFVVSCGAGEAQTYESYEAARKAQGKTVGSILFYKVIVPKEEIEEIIKRRK